MSEDKGQVIYSVQQRESIINKVYFNIDTDIKIIKPSDIC